MKLYRTASGYIVEQQDRFYAGADMTWDQLVMHEDLEAYLTKTLAQQKALAVSHRHPGKTVLVVSHKATNRLLLCSLMGIDPRFYRERLAQDLACLNVIDFSDPSRGLVVRLNDISHYAAGV